MTGELGSPDFLRDAFDNAPCAYVVLTQEGVVRAVNATMAAWLRRNRASLVGSRFTDLLTVGGRLHYETHFAPMLFASGSISGITVDLVVSDGSRLPVLVTANVTMDGDGRPEMIRMIAQDVTDRRSYERELLADRRRAETESGRAVALADTLQRSLLPPSLMPPPGLEASAHYQSPTAGDVGGDFYDLFPLSHNRYGFFLGDVCGKGVVAATLTSLTRYTLRAAAVGDEDPVGVLHTLDSVLKQDSTTDRGWCTVLFGSIVKSTNGFEIEIASGGHPPPLLLTADGAARYVPTEGGRAVGLFAKPTFTSARVELTAGDTLLLYTDGLTEARTGRGSARYDDDDAVLSFAAAQSPVGAPAVVAAVRALIEELGAGVEDDAAVLALGVPRQTS